MHTNKYIFFFFLLFVDTANAQVRYQVGFLPSLNINASLSNKIKFNFKTESRHVTKEGYFGEPTSNEYRYILTDFSFLISQKISLNATLSGGYLLRVIGENTGHRAIQQLTIVRKYERFKLAHRLLTDQTFFNTTPTIYRLRYRITTETPLSGDKLNHKEFYLKINHEYLNEVQNSMYDLEIRLVPLLGYVFHEKNKLELGIDYRLDSFLSHKTRNRFWASLNWFLIW